MAKDFYSILGVSKTASESDIKQAYRKLSRELHPDKHKGDKAKEAQFKEVNEAYEVLSDPKKKAAYDQFGSADYANMGGGFSGFQGFDPSQFEGMGGFGDIFESFFGAGGGRKRDTEHKGKSVSIELNIPFMESVTGTERQVSFRAFVSCTDCGGTGAAEGSKMTTCTDCGGTGTVTRTVRSLFGVVQQNVVCGQCHGSGKVTEKPCKACKGDGRTQGEKTITVRVPAGVDDGQTLRIVGEGGAGRHGGKSGDLLVGIRVTPDPRFERQGDDVRSGLALRCTDAVLGSEVQVETVHGTTIVSIPPGTQSGQVLRLKGKGMPVVNTSRRGDHYVTIDVVIPTKLSKEQRALFEQLRNLDE